MSVFSVSLPDDMVTQVDDAIATRDYQGRSEFVRAALREFLLQLGQESPREGQRTATLTVVYSEQTARRITEVRHEFDDVVKSALHSHTAEHCVEVFLLAGKAALLRGFADRLRGAKGIHLVQLTFTDRLEGAP